MADSECSTPAKKIKVSTWASLLDSISKEDKKGLDVTRILENSIKATAFLCLNIQHKRLILEDILPEQDLLIEKIILCTETYQPISLREKIMQYLLVPSKVTLNQVIAVANIIFDAHFVDLNQFKKDCKVEYKCDNLYTPIEDLKRLIDVVLESFYFHLEMSYNVTIDEDAGYLPLGVLVSRFAKALSNEFNVDRWGNFTPIELSVTTIICIQSYLRIQALCTS